ncbi:hypothetical protein [Bifidobacterium catulorum]|uniref:Signal transduction histidine kinase subgroup 3 dimerisation and phosphoacceptor domain-containing protein n=1 Tax=Bifidobacterium catulorum TaxID=1630173 RepID=A0A2U2MR17_9BIFI|nr:hypothetical protein [Bifidobacterium catulorum]PWG59291.1 hypothetical protein DF200_08395 [Bifidobacterium catulorum]
MNAAERWLRSHWFRVLIAFVVLVATVIEWAAIPPVYPLNGVLSGASIVCILLSPFLPRVSGWLIIGTVVARLFILDLSGPNPLWAAYLALAIIGYDSSIPVAVAALLVISFAECVPVAVNSFNALSATWLGLVNYIAMFVFATMIGMALRWRRQRDEIREQAMALERRQWEMDMLRRNMRLGSRIHDSASGGLSYIALTAQRQLRRIGDDAERDAERRDWWFVNEQALAVLAEIHHVIDLLEQPQRRRADAGGDSVSPGDASRTASACQSAPARRTIPNVGETPPRRTTIEMIDDAVRNAGTRLDQLGFHGRIDVRGDPPDDCDAESVSAAVNLIGEISANITRHLIPESGDYCLMVTLGSKSIELMETNPLPASESSDSSASLMSNKTGRTAKLRSHGSGLALHRRIITDLGGELNTSAEDGDWVVYARIPLHGAVVGGA